MCFVFVRILHPRQSGTSRKRCIRFPTTRKDIKRLENLQKFRRLGRRRKNGVGLFRDRHFRTRKQEHFADGGIDADLCAHLCSAMLLQIESPESGALREGVHLVKPFEDFVQLFGRNADARVADIETQPVPFAFRIPP